MKQKEWNQIQEEEGEGEEREEDEKKKYQTFIWLLLD